MSGFISQGRVIRLRALVGFVTAVMVLSGLSVIATPASPAAAAPGDGSVTGTVTVPSGYVVTDVVVWVVDWGTDAVVYGPVSPDALGAYSFTGVADGHYTVFAEAYDSGLAWQWWSGGRDKSEATDFTITDGSAQSGIDFTMVVGGSIAGTVTVPSGFTGEDVMVGAGRPTGSAAIAPTGSTTESATIYVNANADGSYALGGLVDLPMVVRFSGMGHWLYSEYYDDVYQAGLASPVSVTLGATTPEVDADLGLIHDVVVQATFRDAGSSLCYTVTRSDDAVSMSDCTEVGVSEAHVLVPPGDYTVSAYESNATYGDMATLWWNNTAADRTVEANATLFTPTALEVEPWAIASFDFTGMYWPGEDPTPGSITLNLSNWTDGGAASGGCMQVYNASQVIVGQDCAGSAGLYTVGSLLDGTYKVKLSNFTGAASSQWYSRSASFVDAVGIVIADGFAFSEAYSILPPHTSVGRVVNEASEPLSGGYVEVWGYLSVYPPTWAPVRRVAVAADGTWVIPDFICRTCSIRFTGFAGYGDEWIADSPGPYRASSVDVGVSSGIGVYAQVLEHPEGTLKGTVVTPSTFTGETACVVLYENLSFPTVNRPLAVACGAPGDPFEFRNLRSNTYALCVTDTTNPDRGCWVAASYQHAWVEAPGHTYAPFAVTEGGTTTVSIAFGGTITASPANLAGGSVSGGCMDVYAESSGALVGTDCTDDAGVYSVSVGTDSSSVTSYKLLFRGFPGYPNQWYNYATSLSSGAGVSVQGGATTAVTGVTLLDSTLLQPRVLTGRVLGAGGVPLTGGFVEVWGYSTFTAPAARVAVAADGTWATGSLPQDWYRVRFTGFAGLADEWHNNVSMSSSGTAVSTSSTSAVVVPTATLDQVEGVLTGTIVKPSNFTGGTVCVVVYERNSGGRPLGKVCGVPGGSFEFRNLPAGNYGLCVADTTNPTVGCTGTSYTWDFVGGATPDTATAFAVTAGNTATATLVFGGTIQAAPKDLLGNPVTGGCMDVYAESSGALVGTDCTDDAGTYSVSTGADSSSVSSYKLYFRAFSGFPNQWYNYATSLSSGAAVSVQAGATTTVTGVTILGSTVLQPGVLTGRVLGAGGVPLTGGFVEVWGYSTYTAPAARVAVAADGTWAMGSLAQGTYLIRFTGFAGLADEWNNNVSVGGWYGTPVSTSSSSAVVVPTATLDQVEGALVGTIVKPTDFTGGTVCVVVYERGSYGRPLGTVCGVPGGSFEFRNLPAGNYGLCAADTANPTEGCSGTGYAWDFVGGSSPGSATSFAVTAGNTTTATMVFGGTITATPTVAAGHSLSGGCMDVYAGSSGPLVASDCEPDGGAFSVAVGQDSSVFSGGYRVFFHNFTDGVDEWYNNATTQSAATAVTVEAGAAVPLTIALAPWGSIGGIITVPEGITAEFGCMTASNDDYFDWTCADPATGEYLLQVPPGQYQVEFLTQTSETAFEIYDGAASWSDATWVTVTSDGVILLNADLEVGAQITGTVSLTGGGVATDGCMWVYEPDGGYVTESCVDASGDYVVDRLPAGTYYLYFTGYDTWADEWYGNARDQATANPVTVTSGGTATANMTLSAMATVTGTVTAPGGGVASGGCVALYEYSDDYYTYVTYGCADANGVYSLLVPAGTYHLLFGEFVNGSGAGLSDEWYNNQPTLDASAAITLTPGETFTANAQLALGSVSAMTVVDDFSGAPAQNGCIHVYGLDGGLVTVHCVDDLGHASITLPTGSYAFYFSGFDSTSSGVTRTLADQYYNQKTSFDAATLVEISGLGSVARTARLARPASISGVVTLPTGAAMDGWVALYDADDSSLVDWTYVNPDGTYFLEGLLGGARLQVLFDGFTGAAYQWYPSGNLFFFSQAPQVLPAAGGNHTMNLWMSQEGVIAGRFDVPSSFVGTEVCATALYPNGDYIYPVEEVCGDVGAAFEMRGLPSDRYYWLEFSDSSGHTAYYPESLNWTYGSRFLVPYGSTFTLVQPTVSVSGPSSLTPGSMATLSVGVSGNATGSGVLQYQLPGQAWTTSSLTVPIVNGVGSVSFGQSPPTMSYRVVYGWGVSNVVTIALVVPTVSVSGPSSLTPGSMATLSVGVSGNATGSGVLQYQLPGQAWTTSSLTVPIVNGVGSVSFGQSPPTMSYRVTFGGGVSNVVTIALVVPTVSVSGPSSLTPGSMATLSVGVSGNATGSGVLQYQLPGQAWTTSSLTVPIVNGVGSVSFGQSPPTMSYRVTFGGGVSNVVTIALVVPTVSVSGPSSLTPGSMATLSVGVSGNATGSGVLQYQLPGQAWTTSSLTVPIVNGVGSVSFGQSPPTMSYRVTFGGGVSNVVTIALVVPTVSVSGPSSLTPGSMATLSVGVSGNATGSGVLQYQLPGQAWTTSSLTVPIVNGVGSVSFGQSPPTMSYRVTFGGGVSNVVTIALVVPTVSVSGPSSLTPGSMATLSVGVSGNATGSGVLQYQLPGQAWTTSSLTVPIVNGVGSVSFGQSPPTMSYRVTFGGGVSNVVTIALVVPTVSVSGPSSLTPGSMATLSVGVSGNATGSGVLQYQLPGQAWTTSSLTVPIVNGVGSVSFGQSPPTMSYRVTFGGGVSNVVTIALVVPTVSVSGPSSLTPGSMATLSVGVSGNATGSGVLQYQLPGQAWTTSSLTVPIVNGVGSVSFGQSPPTMSYRVTFGGGVSNVVTIALVSS